MMTRDLPCVDALPESRRARDILAAALRAGSRFLERLAHRLARVRGPARADPVLEFYAEAGAPEGALYVDGRLLGTVAGVTRL